MNVDYDKFRNWLEESERREGRCSEEWEKAHPGCQQSVYRNGMWYAFREAGQALARFVIDPEYNGQHLPDCDCEACAPKARIAYTPEGQELRKMKGESK